LNGYWANPGQTVFFDGSGSYSDTSEIARWDWDLDGDDVYELIDGGPAVNHVYDDHFDGLMQLRVTDADGLTASISVPVKIDVPFEQLPIPAKNISARFDGSTAVVAWTAAEDPKLAWQVTVDGFPIGYVAPDGRAVTITDLELGKPVTIGIAPVDTDAGVGEAILFEIDYPQAMAAETPGDSFTNGTFDPSTAPELSADGFGGPITEPTVVRPDRESGASSAPLDSRRDSRVGPVVGAAGIGVVLFGVAVAFARYRKNRRQRIHQD
jgi:hypothetical protein